MTVDASTTHFENQSYSQTAFLGKSILILKSLPDTYGPSLNTLSINVIAHVENTYNDILHYLLHNKDPNHYYESDSFEDQFSCIQIETISALYEFVILSFHTCIFDKDDVH